MEIKTYKQSELAELFNKHRNTILRWTQNGKLMPVTFTKGENRFTRRALREEVKKALKNR